MLISSTDYIIKGQNPVVCGLYVTSKLERKCSGEAFVFISSTYNEILKMIERGLIKILS